MPGAYQVLGLVRVETRCYVERITVSWGSQACKSLKYKVLMIYMLEGPSGCLPWEYRQVLTLCEWLRAVTRAVLTH